MVENINFIHNTAIVEHDVEIGNLTKVWHWTHVDNKAKIGNNCSLGQNVYIGKNVVIGNNCKIQNNVSIFTGVTLGNNVFVGPSAVFCNVQYPDARIDQHDKFLTTTIEDNVSIGANATILPGITLGKDCMIGAGAVVTKDVLEFETVVGNPACEL